jgi:hypothetical protein
MVGVSGRGGGQPSVSGRGWSAGLTAQTDPRVARSAAARRGRPRRPYKNRRGAPVSWAHELAYAVGLIATDGCLYNDGRHVAFTSKDLDLIRTFLSCLGRLARIRTKRGLGRAFQVEFSDAPLHRWLRRIGIGPRKSLTLGALDVPDEFLLSVVRGLLDGDGTIHNAAHAPTVRRYPGYLYERLSVSFLFC